MSSFHHVQYISSFVAEYLSDDLFQFIFILACSSLSSSQPIYFSSLCASISSPHEELDTGEDRKEFLSMHH